MYPFLLTPWRFGCIFLLAIAFAACQPVRPQSTRPKPLPQDPFVEVYFNHSEASDYVEPYRHQRRAGDNLEQVIVDAINTAGSTIDVAVQELRLPKIAQALGERKKAGVKVRVILENTYSRPWSRVTATEVAKWTQRERDSASQRLRDRYNEFFALVDQNRDNQLSPEEINQGDALVILQNAGIPILDDAADGSAGSGYMHHKFVIVDGQKVIVTSANFTPSDVHGDFKNPSSLGNANNLLKIDSFEVASLFTKEFNIMWGDGPGGKPDSKFGVKKPYRSPQLINLVNTNITVQFSPTSLTVPWEQSSNGLIGKTLGTASQSVDLALFVFSEQGLANILETDHNRGVQIQALIDPDFAYRSYSEALDMMGVALANNCQYEMNNHPWQNPISTVGIPQLKKGDLLHHKFGVIDGQTVITGSHNWSKAANQNNDEAVLVIQSPTVAAHFQREFQRLYADAVLGVPDRIRRKIAAQQQCHQNKTVSGNLSRDVIITRSAEIKNNQPESSAVKAGESLRKTEIVQKVNLNTATQAELEALPGVGPKLAQRIIQARQNKPFTSLQDFDKIPGVGPSLLEKLGDRVTW